MPHLSHFTYCRLNALPVCLGHLKNPPQNLYCTGDLELLNAPLKVAIVGTRKPSLYTQHISAALAKNIAKIGGVVVSGGAIGVDIIAQKNALPRTIMFAPCSLDYIYPPSNAPIIKQIAQEGLVLSEYEKKFTPYRHSFLERNRLVVLLSDMVIIPEAQTNSGSMASAQLALAYQKPLFVLPQRLFESAGTHHLLEHGKARAIYDIEQFSSRLAKEYGLSTALPQVLEPDFLQFCRGAPTFEQAYAVYGDFLLEQELLGVIKRQNGRVVLA